MAARIVAHIMARTPNLAMRAASCSPSSVRWVQVQPLQPLQPLLPLRPLHPLQLQPRHRHGPSALGRASSASIQSRLSEVGCRPCTPNFRRLRRGRSRPRRPLFLIWHRFLPTYWDFESPPPRPKACREPFAVIYGARNGTSHSARTCLSDPPLAHQMRHVKPCMGPEWLRK